MQHKQLLSATLTFSMVIASAMSQGFKCPGSNFRLFELHADLEKHWVGKYEEADKMCSKSGHKLAQDDACLKQYFSLNTNASEAWVDKSLKRNDANPCATWSREKGAVAVACDQTLRALCQGLAVDDHPKSYPNGPFPYTQVFGATTSAPSTTPAVDAYYVVCGVLGVILISIVIAAAIWRSGYVNNRYSFRRLPAGAAAAAASSQKPAKKSHTVTSQLDSEIPVGYVKASVTKETIA